MQLKVINSNSDGNCYLLEASSGEVLILELGVKFTKIKQALNFNISKVVGALVTHSHLDHSCSVFGAMKAGITVFATLDEFAAMGIEKHHRAVEIFKNKSFILGNFTILPFDIRHDTPDPVGFLINHNECGNVLFLTDTYYTPYTFRGLNNIIIECNYSQDIVKKKMEGGDLQQFLRNRIMKSHMHLDTCKDVLLANDLTAVNNIVLIHLSDNHSDAALFESEIKRVTGKNVTVADAGVVLDNFNKTPF